MSELIGKTIGQYQIVEQIGKGGMATIFKAYQPSIDRYVAVKVLPKEFAEDPNFVKRFEHEAKSIAALEHPHILPVHDFGYENNISFMVMRYIKGGTLSNQMGDQMSYERITQVVGNVARALDYAHSRGVVHRDIKPSNVLIDEHGEVLLTDFGIAKIMEGSNAAQLTATGSVLGTPAYMAPEQAQGGKIDGRTDIYSLGVVLYELLTGSPPYNAETPFAIVFKHVNEPLPPPRSIKPEIPEAFERAVLKAMAKNPDQRFETAGQMQQALQNALKESQGIAVAPPVPAGEASTQAAPKISAPKGDSPQAKKSSSMGPLLIGGIVVALLLCLVGGGAIALLLFARGENQQAGQVAAVAEATLSAPDNTENTENEIELDPPPENEDEDNAPAESGGERIIFEDDFSSNENDWFVGQQNDEWGGYLVEIEEGLYRTYLNASTEDGNSVWFDTFAPEFENAEISVEVAYVESDVSHSYGIIFRATPEGDFYLFEVDNSGFIVFLSTADGEWFELTDYTETSAINPEGPNTLTVVADGDTMIFFINDEEVAEVQDDTLDRGTFALMLDLYEEGELLVEFEDVVVIEFEE